MGWIRANRRGIGATALLALAFQFTVALGHVHAPALAATPVVAVHTDKTPGNGDELPQRQADVTCDICAVLHMATAMKAGAAPSLALPHLFVVTQHALLAERKFTSPRRLLAQSRAPPTV